MTKRQYDYVNEDDPFMQEARRVAETESLDREWPTGVVIVKDKKVIGRGANGSEYHLKFGCRRKELGMKTGKRYDLCEGCDPKNHAEARAVRNMGAEVYLKAASSAYLWGHWWCCEPCWKKMIDVGIKKVYLVKAADVRFNQVRNTAVN